MASISPLTRLVLKMLSTNVVPANAARPSGPGSAGVQPALRPAVERIAALVGRSEQRAVSASVPLADWFAHQRAIDAGVFGAPSYVVNGEIFWGQDRLDFVQRRLAGA